MVGGFFAIFTPNMPRENHELPPDTNADYHFALPLSRPLEQAYALQYTAAVAGLMHSTIAASAGRLCLVRTINDLHEVIASRQLGIIFHIEGAEAIDADLEVLPFLYAAGLRSVGLVWSRPNAFGTGVPFQYPHSPDIGPGLTAAGKALVRACNDMGILVDVSHLNEKGFWDVAAVTSAPLVATHSNAHAICPTPRNLTDKQLDAIAESGGIVGINFYVHFLRADGRWQKITSLQEIVHHIDYIVDRIGIDHVGFGSDFDGVEEIPQDLGNAAGLPRLMIALRTRGYDDSELRKIAYLNWQRVLTRTWRAP
jgi:membrane dipeptidase